MHYLARIATGFQNRIRDTFASRPTPEEGKRIDSIRRDFAAIPLAKPQSEKLSEIFWCNNLNQLRDLVLNADPRFFLRWPVIKYTMFVGNAGYIATELAYLKSLPDWETRWQPAIRENSFGHPLRYDGFAGSSGNLIHHAYHIAQFEKHSSRRIQDIKFVFEFGGGYGSMCRLLHNLGFRGRYLIFDLPAFSRLQRYFLSSIGIPLLTIAQFGTGKSGALCLDDQTALRDCLESTPPSDALFMATWSVSETPVYLREVILPLIRDFSDFLIGYQDQFNEVDNLAYFAAWQAKMPAEITWHAWSIAHLPHNNYLIGSTSSN